MYAWPVDPLVSPSLVCSSVVLLLNFHFVVVGCMLLLCFGDCISVKSLASIRLLVLF